MIVPMIDPIACPPRAGALSTMTTLRPSLAASRAAEIPEIPAPTTQISATTVFVVAADERRTVRVVMVSDMIEEREVDYTHAPRSASAGCLARITIDS